MSPSQKPGMLMKGHGGPLGTPMSQASTVPNTPMVGMALPDCDMGFFSRQMSDMSVMSGEVFLDDLSAAHHPLMSMFKPNQATNSEVMD
jgi:hypothetical protein